LALVTTMQWQGAFVIRFACDVIPTKLIAWANTYAIMLKAHFIAHMHLHAQVQSKAQQQETCQDIRLDFIFGPIV